MYISKTTCHKKARREKLLLLLVSAAFFIGMKNAVAQCTTGTLYPTATFTPTCTGTAQNIVLDAFAGEYSNINVTTGITYTFSSSVPTDFITVAIGTTPVTSGTTPLTWTSNTTGTIRFYIHLNASCGQQNANRTRSISCTSCVTPSGLSASNITSTSATVTWSLPSGSAQGYQWEVRTSGAAGSGSTGLTASGNASPSFVVGANVSGLSAGTTYSLYVRTDCGSSNFSAWSSAYVFYTACPDPTGLSATNITASSATVNWTAPSSVTPAGYQWEVRSSGAGGSGASGLAASGSTGAGITTANATGLVSGSTYSIYVRTNCGGNFSNWTGPTTFATILSCYPPTALGASNLTSTSATVNWSAPAIGSPAGYDWEVRTSGAGGAGATGLFSSGSTVAPTVSASISGLTQGTTYSLYVRTSCTGGNGISSWAGPYSFSTPPVNDLCSAAITLTCSNMVSGTTVGATNDGITDQCGASDVAGQVQTSPGVWYKIAGANQLVTLSLCGSGYDTRISILDGSCGAFTCVTGNDDYCNNQSQVSFSAYTGHTYYVLVHGYGTASGTFSLLTTCAVLCTPVSSNDNCSSPTALSISSPGSATYTSDNNICATSGALTNPASCGSAFASFIDVFYSFNSGSNNMLYLEVATTGVTAPVASGSYYYALYTGSCSSPTYISCGPVTFNAITTLTGLSSSTQYLLRLYYVGATGVAGNYKLMLQPPFVWTGTIDTDWMKSGNWQAGTVPNSSTGSVVIQNVTNKPLIGIPNDVSVKDLMINNGATLTIDGKLKIAGNVSKVGIGPITANTGTVEFNGTSAQTIAINTFASNSINNLVINNSAGVTLGGTLTVTGTVTPTSGILSTSGYLILASNATKTARIAQGGSNYINGDVTVQKYIGGGYRRFRFLSHPFVTLPVTQLTSNIDITGSITGINANAFTATGTNSPSAFYFNEALDNGVAYGSGGNNLGWSALSSGNSVTSLTGSQAIRLFIRGIKGQGLSAASYTPSPVTLNLTGAVTQGEQVVPLSYTSGNANKGWNLIGNPYASNIDWDVLYASSSGINNAVYLYRPSTASYASYVNGSGTNGGSRVIEMNNGFFVVANTVGAQVKFTEAAKTADNTATTMLRSFSHMHNRLGVRLKKAGYADKGGDEIIVRFGDDNATDRFDAKYDAYDIPGGEINLYAMDSDSVSYSVYHGTGLRNSSIEDREIKLGYTVSQEGNYTLKGYIMNEFTNANQVYLKDRSMNTLTLINDSTEYSFNIAQQELKNSSRFSLVFNPMPRLSVSMPKQFTVSPNPASSKVQVVFRNNEVVSSSINILDMTGRIVSHTDAGKTNTGSITIDISKLAKGAYTVQLIAGNDISFSKLLVQ